jgi:hypothetical protein
MIGRLAPLGLGGRLGRSILALRNRDPRGGGLRQSVRGLAGARRVVNVRRCKSADLPLLAGLVIQFDAGWERRADLDLDRYLSSRLARAQGAIFVASDAQDLFGYIDAGIVGPAEVARPTGVKPALRRLLRRQGRPLDSLFQPRRYGFIYDIFVIDSLRRSEREIGTLLFEQSLEWFAQQNVDHIEASVAMSNAAGRSFLAKMGCVEVRTLVRKSLT